MRRKSKKAQELDFIGMVKGIPELFITLVPIVLLFIVTVSLVYQCLFFIPADWKWTTVDNSISFGTLYTEWTARRLFSLLLAAPLTYIFYKRAAKLLKKLTRPETKNKKPDNH